MPFHAPMPKTSAPHRGWRVAMLTLVAVVLATVLAVPGTLAQAPEDPYELLEVEPLNRTKPFLRAWWAFEQRVYPDRTFPDDARERALRALESIK